MDLDFLTQIVNVHWSGGTVFVYGELAGNKLHYVEVSSLDATPAKQTIILPEPALTDDTSLFGITGSSYAKVKPPGDDKGVATLLVCGLRSVGHYIDDGIGNLVKVFDRHALIYISNDGIRWREARHQAAVISNYDNQTSLGAVALVWEPTIKSFYYDQHFSEFHPHTGVSSELEQILKSSNGTAWGMNSSTAVIGSYPDYKSAFPSFCESNDCTDERGQNVPDGVMANDVETNSTAKPTKPPLFVFDRGFITYTPGDNKVEIKREEQNDDGSTKIVKETVSIPGIGCITCVAGRDGVLMAGGFVAKDDEDSAGAVALSTDGGKTWKAFDKTSKGVATMIAVPKSDI